MMGDGVVVWWCGGGWPASVLVRSPFAPKDPSNLSGHTGRGAGRRKRDRSTIRPLESRIDHLKPITSGLRNRSVLKQFLSSLRFSIRRSSQDLFTHYGRSN